LTLTHPHKETKGEALGLVVKLQFATPEEFLAQYGVNITLGGIYLRAKSVKPPGTAVKLELKLADGTPIIQALTVIHFVTGQAGQGISGMGLRFLQVEPATQRFLDTSVAPLPHAHSPHPPLPPGVGPADHTVPGAAGAVATPPFRNVAPRASTSPGTIPTASVPPAAAMTPPRNVAPRASTSPGTIPTASVPPPVEPPPRQVAPPTQAAPPIDAEPDALPEEDVSLEEDIPPPLAAPPSPPASAPAPAPVVASSRPATPWELPPTLSTASPATLSAPPFEPPKEEPKRIGPVIGIDLGTTNSCAAHVRNGKPFVLHSREGHNTVPSVIALNARGKLVVGHPAKGQMLANPRHTVYGSKRLIGRLYESPIVQQIKDRFAYEITPGENGEAAVRLGDQVYTLQQISALVLREVREMAQNQIGQPISRAVITVPAYYNDNQRQAVREAGRLAGLHVERIVNEPTAAALAYGYGRKLSQRVLVYDLGGGTFDASVLELHDTVYEVLSTGGDTFLGGIDFDNAIVEYLVEEFDKQLGRTFYGDRVAMQRLHDAAERAKCLLSERMETRVHVAFLTMIDGKPYDLDITLTREKLIELTGALVDRTLRVCGEVLQTKGLQPGDIDEVILVGGQSRFPLVHEKLTHFFGKPPTKNVHPDEVVALGAALLAHSLGQTEGVLLIDVLAVSIGVGLPGGRFKPVLERNVALPAKKQYTVNSTRDDQPEMDLVILQGESQRALENEYLGTLRLTGLPGGPRGSVKVNITFEVNNECILKVTAREESSGAEVMSVFTTKNTPEPVRQQMGLGPSRPEVPVGHPTNQHVAAGRSAYAAQQMVELPALQAAQHASAQVGVVGWLKRLIGR
jgi:molecular chaperone DnaK